MKPTAEQQAAIDTNENIVISALAGSGKTTSLYHYIKARPVDCRILYIAFNKSVQVEAEEKFADIDHVFLHVRTAHSLAYEKIVRKNRYKMDELKPETVMGILDLEDYILASHVVKMVNYYCTCSAQTVQEIDYRSTVNSAVALAFVDENYSEIEMNAVQILAKMDKAEIAVTHDFYLKKWQLSKPKLYYDYILFDEGQDASEVMLDIFNKQSGIKVIVGDSHQQIYSWRNAVNSLDKVKYKQFKLSQSFRFDQNIADLAVKVIKWKVNLLQQNDLEDFTLIGSGQYSGIQTRALVARTNYTLITRALDAVVIKELVKAPYFEGGFDGYSINSMYGIVNDINHIKKGEFPKIKTPALLNTTSIEELKSYIDKSEDILVEQALKLVENYGEDLNKLVNTLKSRVTTEKKDSDMIFTTVHKAKGMEYDYVEIADDFKTKSTLFNIIKNAPQGFEEIARKYVNEEINLLYVAVTRSKGIILPPEELFK